MIEKANNPTSHHLENSLPQLADVEAPQSSRYKAIAELLGKTRASCERVGDDSLICIVDAAYRICQACCCTLDEVEWHQVAYSMAHQRQFQLMQELSQLIDLISTPEILKRDSQPFLPSFENEPGNLLPEEFERLVHCIKGLLGPQPSAETSLRSSQIPIEEKSEVMPKFISQSENPPEKVPENKDDRDQFSHLSEIYCENSNPPIQDISVDDCPLTHEQLALEAEDNTGVTQAHVQGNDGSSTPPSLAIYFLSPFSVLLDEQPVVGWPNCKGKSIFKYLVTHRERPISKEVLMETFWPEIDPDSARNNLNVSIYGLRKALGKVNPDFPYVLFQDACYRLNPELRIWVDAEAFMEHVRKAKEFERHGDQLAAIHEYRAAETIYQSEFLVEDRYEDWLIGARQNFQDIYLTVMNRLSCYYFDQQDYEACVTICTKALTDDTCNEELHQRLMRCYGLMGYTHLALRQFHVCRETLHKELSISPSKETMRLFEQIRQRQAV